LIKRPRFSEDVLVRALDFCDEHGFRFGQFLSNVLTAHVAGTKGLAEQSPQVTVERTLFYIENGGLEGVICKALAEHQADALERKAS
jgi:hypothetical protein